MRRSAIACLAGTGALLGALLGAACGTRAQGADYFGAVDPPEGQVLRYISGSEPESLDPQVSTGQPEARIYLAIYEGLTEYDPITGEAIPAIAERWEANADNSEFLFHLRRNARWSNGDPITAHDFVYSIRRGLSPALAARSAYLAYYIHGAQAYNEGRGRAGDVGVDAIDDFTVRIRLTQSVPFLAGLVAHQFFRLVPRKAIEQYGDRWTQPGHIVTCGAFKLQTWRPYDRLVVVRDPMYWDAASRQARPDHVLPGRGHDDHDESLQGGRGGRGLQPHRTVRVGRRRSAARRTTWTGPRTRSSTTRSTRRSRRSTTSGCARRSTWPSTRPRSRRIGGW